MRRRLEEPHRSNRVRSRGLSRGHARKDPVGGFSLIDRAELHRAAREACDRFAKQGFFDGRLARCRVRRLAPPRQHEVDHDERRDNEQKVSHGKTIAHVTEPRQDHWPHQREYQLRMAVLAAAVRWFNNGQPYDTDQETDAAHDVLYMAVESLVLAGWCTRTGGGACR